MPWFPLVFIGLPLFSLACSDFPCFPLIFSDLEGSAHCPPPERGQPIMKSGIRIQIWTAFVAGSSTTSSDPTAGERSHRVRGVAGGDRKSVV